jgi:hypothetical protein
VSEQSEHKHPWGCATTPSNANIAVMSVKIKVLQLDLRKLQNCAILGCLCCMNECMNLFLNVV